MPAIWHNGLGLDLLHWKVVGHTGLAVWHIDLESGVASLSIQGEFGLFSVVLRRILDASTFTVSSNRMG